MLATGSDHHVAASGELTDLRHFGSTTTWTYEQTVPMATYLATVQIGRYAVPEHPGAPVPVRTVAPPRRNARAFAAGFACYAEWLRSEHCGSRSAQQWATSTCPGGAGNSRTS